ncbi:MAG: hypothetical protein JNG84_02900 [Archangium sp.]|nr:hypothetical protein [Archangium sp.]
MVRLSCVCLSMVLLAACGTTLKAERRESALYSFEQERPGTSLLDVSIPDEVLARAPNDFGNIAGLVSKTLRDTIDAQGGFMAFDKTDLGFKGTWDRGALRPVEGVPAGVQTPLVTLVRVVDWRTVVETYGKQTRDVARVHLVLSTWTREGKEVSTDDIEVVATAGVNQRSIRTNHERVLSWYRTMYDDFSAPTLNTRAELFMAALRDAMALHCYPFFSHRPVVRYSLMDDEPLKPGVQAALSGNYDEAQALWLAVAEKDPAAHGALYDAAVIHAIKGDDEAAYRLLVRAMNIEDKYLYLVLRSDVEARLTLRKKIMPDGMVLIGVLPK